MSKKKKKPVILPKRKPILRSTIVNPSSYLEDSHYDWEARVKHYSKNYISD